MSQILRIVRLTFQADKTRDFEQIFKESQPLIEAFEGCMGVELKRDFSKPNVYYTVSRWQCHEDLDKYRASQLFKTTWTKTKALFSEKAAAYSLINEWES